MKNYLFASVAVIACVSTAQASPQVEGMKEMVAHLRQSVDIVKSCVDEASTKKAVKELTKLRKNVEESGRKLNKAGQAPQEDMDAIMPLLQELFEISKQGEEEIQRITKANLLSPELKAILESPVKEIEETTPTNTEASPANKEKVTDKTPAAETPKAKEAKTPIKPSPTPAPKAP